LFPLGSIQDFTIAAEVAESGTADALPRPGG
jgi:hypothetical protein